MLPVKPPRAAQDSLLVCEPPLGCCRSKTYSRRASWGRARTAAQSRFRREPRGLACVPSDEMVVGGRSEPDRGLRSWDGGHQAIRTHHQVPHDRIGCGCGCCDCPRRLRLALASDGRFDRSAPTQARRSYKSGTSPERNRHKCRRGRGHLGSWGVVRPHGHDQHARRVGADESCPRHGVRRDPMPW